LKLTIGQKIRKARMAEEMSLEELSYLTGISVSVLSRIEKDEFRRVPVEKIAQIAPVIKKSVVYLCLDTTQLEHLSEELVQFLLTPESAEFLESTYLDWKKRNIN